MTIEAKLAALLAEVYANPADDAPRLVLADALLGRGDPRGELIALQLGGSDPGKIERLLEAHGRDWLGPLARIAKRVAFRRGFPAVLELTGRRDREIDFLELATIEELAAGDATEHNYAGVLGRAHGLRRVEIESERVLAALADCPAPIEHVALRLDLGYVRQGYTRVADAARFTAEVLPILESIATLSSIALDVDLWPALTRSTLFPRLTRVTLGGYMSSALAAWPRAPAGLELVVAARSRLDGLSDLDRENAGTVAFRRDATQRTIARFDGPYGFQVILQVLGQVEDLGVVELVSPPADVRERVRGVPWRTAPKNGFEVRELLAAPRFELEL